MGFPDDARDMTNLWRQMFKGLKGNVPDAMWATLGTTVPQVVQAVAYHRYPEIGDKSLAEMLPFKPKEQQMIEEAAGRLAAGNDPGVVPERFLIGAARIALDRRLARPGIITRNFYRELTRR